MPAEEKIVALLSLICQSPQECTLGPQVAVLIGRVRPIDAEELMKGSAPIRRRGGCRLEAPIEAGRTLYHMRQAGMTTVSLVVIRRQRNAQLRSAVELACSQEACRNHRCAV